MSDSREPADDRAPARAFLGLLRSALADGSFRRLVLTRPRAAGPAGDRAAAASAAPGPVKVSARLLQLKGRVVVNLVETHASRDLTRNLDFAAAQAAIADALANRFNQAHLFLDAEEIQLLTARRGRQTLLRGRRQTAPHPAGPAPRNDGEGDDRRHSQPAAADAAPLAPHDRAKHRPVPQDRPYLRCLGLTDGQGRLVPSMARKWKQINKFVEVLDHALGEAGLTETGHAEAGDCRPLEVLDFGSGKGYLTFATHDHLRHTLGLPVRVTGVDVKADMIELCNRAAAEVGAEGLAFELGDVASRAPQRVDVMIALHACDTATDHAMAAGVQAGAALIVCAPCCHKELRPQLLSPHPLRPVLKHGVHLGQQADMLTDGLRAMLLEACGYDTQVFEFISPEHTSKNKMILAVRRDARGHRDDDGEGRPATDRLAQGRRQIDELKRFYGIREQCLERLLQNRLAATTEPDGETPGLVAAALADEPAPASVVSRP